MEELISKRDAIEVIEDELDKIDHVPQWVFDRLTNRLRELPSTQPEQKRGKWLSHYDYCKKHGYIPSGVIALWWCDQCEQGVEHPTNFCPNCGSYNGGEQ